MGKLEEVARALCAHEQGNPDEMVAGKPRWQHYVEKARIAIEALRKPTESMVNAAYAARKRRVSQAGIGQRPHDFHPADDFDAMLEALLSETTETERAGT